MSIPEQLAAVLRTAAGTAPPYPGDLAAVRRRGRARVRHRALAGAGSVAVAAALAVAAPVVLAGPDGSPVPAPGPVAPPAATGATAPEVAPAQRLVIDGPGVVMTEPGIEPPDGLTVREAYEWYRDQPGTNGALGPLAEVRPDGSVAPFDRDLPGIDSVRELVALPDGRLVVLGQVDRLPGVERQDGPCIEGLEFPLLVVAPDGSTSPPRDVRVRCQHLQLVAADAGTAYLLRGSRLVAHDLATGAEQVLVDSTEAVPAERPGMDYAAGRLAVAVNDAQCGGLGELAVRVTDVATGETVEHPVPGGCDRLGGPVRLSPDGRYAAIAYHRFVSEVSHELRVAVLDLAGGGLVEDRVMGTETGRDRVADGDWRGVGGRSSAITGLAWADGTTLRVAWYALPGPGMYWIPDLTEVVEIAVPG